MASSVKTSSRSSQLWKSMAWLYAASKSWISRRSETSCNVIVMLFPRSCGHPTARRPAYRTAARWSPARAPRCASSGLDAGAERLPQDGDAALDLVERHVQERHAQEPAPAVVAEPLAGTAGHAVGRGSLPNLVP